MTILNKAAFITLAFVYFLIFVGSLVRATGSGMGCPDWPKCYGEWIPPTTAFTPSEEWYQVVFEQRKRKNEKLLGFFSNLGWKNLVERVESHKEIFQAEPVNITKTWIEYLNRLVGVLTGLFMLILLGFSVLKKGIAHSVSGLALLIVLVTGFQGWLGSLVVSTHLVPGMISVHMVLALAIVFLLQLVFVKTLKKESLPSSVSKKDLMYSLLLVFVIVMQLVFGLRVREGVDELFFQGVLRDSITPLLGSDYLIHKGLSWLVLISVGLVAFHFASHSSTSKPLKRSLVVLVCSVLGEIGIGLVFQFSGMQAWAQPLHLLGASLILGMSLMVFLLLLRVYLGKGLILSKL